MKFYFSGVAGKAELGMLRRADVKRVMVDVYQAWSDWFCWGGSKVLDSGAYAMHKRGEYARVDHWLASINELCRGAADWEYVFALDVIGGPDLALSNWRWLRENSDLRLIPVYQWDAPVSHLEEYMVSPVVGIGGLVQRMRDKDQSTLDMLIALCECHRGRFHIFGLNWPKAITALRDIVYSADSSKWLDGARYRRAIFKHSTRGYLSAAPAKFVVESYPELEGMSREELCIWNARNIAAFCEEDDDGT